MQSKEARKEAIRKFKERKPPVGTFAVKCTASGRAWVGTSRNLDSTKNQLWFSLRNGSSPDRSLQDEWNAQGEAAFQYEVLEKIEEDAPELAVADLLKAQRSRWIAQLGARPL